MSNSLEFCKRVAQDPARSTYSDREWSNAKESLDTKLLFDEILNGNYKYRCAYYVDHDRLEFDIEIEFNADAEFDYFTSETIICDGSLYFAPELICAQNVVRRRRPRASHRSSRSIPTRPSTSTTARSPSACASQPSTRAGTA